MVKTTKQICVPNLVGLGTVIGSSRDVNQVEQVEGLFFRSGSFRITLTEVV